MRFKFFLSLLTIQLVFRKTKFHFLCLIFSCLLHFSSLEKHLSILFQRHDNLHKFFLKLIRDHLEISRLQMFFKVGVLKIFINFTGKHLCWGLFKKVLGPKPPSQVFSFQICDIFNNTSSACLLAFN